MFERAQAQRQAISFRGYDYPFALAGLGYAYARCGHVAKGLRLLEQAVEQSTQSICVIWLSEANAQAGRLPQACSLAEQALEVAERQKERGWEARGRRLLGELALHGDYPDHQAAKAHYRQSLRLAQDLGMRPLQAHCHHGLGKLYNQTRQTEHARAELTTAIEMYRDMEMNFWLPETEAALAAVEGR
jgi:tetratricopeptide (TPR) repeat protein